MPWIWLSIGSNIDREANLAAALRALRKRFGPLTLSPVYETEAVGFEGAPFLNLVAGCQSSLSAQQTSAELKQIEAQQGRIREEKKYSSRSIDIDLLTYGDLCSHEEGLQIPRDEILKYAFVLKPLSDVAPRQRHPENGRSYAELWAAFRGDRHLTEVDPPL